MAEASAGKELGMWRKSTAREYFESICIAVIFALFVRTFVAQAFKIPSSSMEDNLLVGDHIVVNKFAYGARPAWLEGILPYRTIQHRDVVVFKYPRDATKDYIKRTIGIGGDKVEGRAGIVYRNGERLDEPYIVIKPRFPGETQAAAERELRSSGPWERTVAAGELWAMGDNRMNSEDSRYWGTVPPGNVKGKALLIYWSFDVPDSLAEVEVNRDARTGEKARGLLYTLLHLPTRTRWRRTFHMIR